MLKYLILGAGPAGLTFANQLLSKGIDSFLVLEKESMAGGLCRSEVVDGAPLDIGGGHFIDAGNIEVRDYLFQFMPETEWNIFDRKVGIYIHNSFIGAPIESNIWQFDIEKQIEYLKSIASAGCNNGIEMPEKFIDWIVWKLGDKISNDYMLPYNRKMFGENLNDLGTYWLYKLPNASFDEILRSCIEKKEYGTVPNHPHFYYPKQYGSGELWLRMAKRLGDKIKYEVDVKEINFNDKSVNNTYFAEKIITTIPITEFNVITGMPDEVRKKIKQLKYGSIQIDYYPEDIDKDYYWIYYPDEGIPYHRILNRHNFCTSAKGYWTETNSNRVKGNESSYHYINKYAYPLNTLNKPEIMKEILEWTSSKNVYGLGRWGEWTHHNVDAVVMNAIKLADQLAY